MICGVVSAGLTTEFKYFFLQHIIKYNIQIKCQYYVHFLSISWLKKNPCYLYSCFAFQGGFWSFFSGGSCVCTKAYYYFTVNSLSRKDLITLYKEGQICFEKLGGEFELSSITSWPKMSNIIISAGWASLILSQKFKNAF